MCFRILSGWLHGIGFMVKAMSNTIFTCIISIKINLHAVKIFRKTLAWVLGCESHFYFFNWVVIQSFIISYGDTGNKEEKEAVNESNIDKHIDHKVRMLSSSILGVLIDLEEEMNIFLCFTIFYIYWLVTWSLKIYIEASDASRVLSQFNCFS